MAILTKEETEPSSQPRALWVVVLFAAIAAAPVLLAGAPGGDFEYHMQHWMEAASESRAGVWYPRWAAQANLGFGEPDFIFYPPLSWVLGGLLIRIFPLDVAPAVYIFMVLVLAGLAMFALARRWLPPPHACIAAVFYTVNPYMLLCAYHRGAVAEMIVGALFPLVLLFALRVPADSGAVVPLALTFAACWLSDLPAAVVMTYALSLMIVTLAVVRRSAMTLWLGVAALALGFALAAFFIIPASYEQRWVQIEQAVSPDFRPESWEYDGRDADAVLEGLIEAFVYAGTALGGACVLLCWNWRRANRAAWWTLAALVIAAIFMMQPGITAVLWTHLPKLEFVQFPWRCLFVLSTCVALLLGVTLRRLHPGWFAAIALLIASAGGVPSGWRAEWHRHVVTQVAANIAHKQGYYADDKYLPTGTSGDRLEQVATKTPDAEATDKAVATVQVKVWAPSRRIIEVHATGPTALRLRLLAYPAWVVRVNGRPVSTKTDPATGQLMVPVSAGSSRVEVSFARTFDRTIGGAVSILAAVLVLMLTLHPKSSSFSQAASTPPMH
jgi:6-pyruvoyl-tetrahydropterin synthase related domain